MSEREYQQRMLKSESKIVICDWDRGSGKSYSIAKHIESKIKNSDGKRLCILVITHVNNQTKHFKNIMHEHTKNNYDYNYEVDYDTNNNMIKVVSRHTDGIRRNVYADINIVTVNNLEKIYGDRYDYIYIDEIALMTAINFKTLESTEYKQMVITASFNDCRHIDYIHYTSKDELNENDWIEQEIKKLMKEFSEIPNSENTTKRREVVLGMIRELKLMKNSNIEIKTESGAVIGTICRPSGTCDDGFFKGGM